MAYSYVIFLKYSFYSAVSSVLGVCSRLRHNSHTLHVIYKRQTAACVGNEPGLRGCLYDQNGSYPYVCELFVIIQKRGRNKTPLERKFCNNDF
jgi:hypothetical protein